MKRAFPILAVLTGVLLSYALYQALVVAPTEQTMGDVQRIFYYHVPSAWTAFILFFINFVASIVYLTWRNAKADMLALVTAEVGVVFCTVNLVTGPIWARPVWGIWWTWDLRLTLTLVLWLIYVSYIVLRRFSLAFSASMTAMTSWRSKAPRAWVAWAMSCASGQLWAATRRVCTGSMRPRASFR